MKNKKADTNLKSSAASARATSSSNEIGRGEVLWHRADAEAAPRASLPSRCCSHPRFIFSMLVKHGGVKISSVEAVWMAVQSRNCQRAAAERMETRHRHFMQEGRGGPNLHNDHHEDYSDGVYQSCSPRSSVICIIFCLHPVQIEEKANGGAKRRSTGTLLSVSTYKSAFYVLDL